MAIPAPTSANKTSDVLFAVSEPLKGPTHAEIAQDQIYVLDYDQLLFADCHFPFHVTDSGSSGNWGKISHYYAEGIDLCGTNNSTDLRWAVYTWASGAGVNWNVRLTLKHGATTNTDTLSVTTSTTSKIWRTTGTLNSNIVNGNGTENECFLEVQFTAGYTGQVWIAGLAVWCGEGV